MLWPICVIDTTPTCKAAHSADSGPRPRDCRTLRMLRERLRPDTACGGAGRGDQNADCGDPFHGENVDACLVKLKRNPSALLTFQSYSYYFCSNTNRMLT